MDANSEPKTSPEISFHSAKEFIDCLLNRQFSTATDSIITPNRWVFRGHADSNWKLQPTAFRDGNKQRLLFLAGRHVTPDGRLETTQIFSEFMLLFRFYKQLEKFGLAIPDNSPELREIFEHPARLVAFLQRSSVDQNCSWPPPEIHGLIALAQHHRLPTRLLDWTYDPLVACYFAVHSSDAKDLAVWCLDTSVLSNSKSETSLIYVATASIRNLLAQQGLFTVTRASFADGDFTKEEDIRALEDRARELRSATDRPALIKLSLPRDHAEDLKVELHRLGYTTARLIPGYDGVVKEMDEGIGFARRDYKFPSRFDCFLHIFIPEESYRLGQAISAIVDPDTGGYKAFEFQLSRNGNPPSEYRWYGGQIGTEAIAQLLLDVEPNIPGLFYHIAGGEQAKVFLTNILGASQFGESLDTLSEKIGLTRVKQENL